MIIKETDPEYIRIDEETGEIIRDARSFPQAQATSDGDESSSSGATSRPQLNPRFVEWLMGVPRGWTSLECSETELCRYKALMRSALLRLCSTSNDRGVSQSQSSGQEIPTTGAPR